jgi:hypothetical protein
MRNYILFLFLSILLIPKPQLVAQINDITRLPVQGLSHSVREAAPIWVSENEIIIFFVNETLDTIYSTRSYDRGISWEEPELVQVIEFLLTQNKIHLSALLTSTGRVILAWSILNDSMKLIYSDDYGLNWSAPVSIIGAGSDITKRYSYNLIMTEWLTGEICLCFYSGSLWRTSYYRLSTDNGTSWFEEDANKFPAVPNIYTLITELSIISFSPDTLLGIFQFDSASTRGIYSRTSTDFGETWQDTVKIVNSILDESRPRIHIDSRGVIWLIYLAEYTTDIEGYTQNDIHYLKSTNNGVSWIEDKRFTRYIGDDSEENISGLDEKIFVSFYSERFTNKKEPAYCIIGETEELYTPPKALNFNISVKNDEKNFTFRTSVIDDEQVAKVEALISGELEIELFDDGMHDDLDPADNVYANAFDFYNLTSNSSYYLDVNKLKIPFDNKGVIADVEATLKSQVDVHATDISNYAIKIDTSISYHFSTTAKYDEGSFIFSAGFFLSGYNEGELWTNAVASAGLVADYLPGKIDADPEDNLNVIYLVNKDDPPFGISWERWKDAVSLGAEFYDGDKDGNYNPVDKNWNGTWDPNEDMPALIGDEIAWCVYNDSQPKENRRWNTVDPQGIEIKQTVFASSHPELEEVIFVRYSIFNTGLVNDVMDSVYFGVWEDADLGDHTDDVVGCDTMLNAGYTYNNNLDNIYGENCPAFFTTYLQGPVYYTGDNTDTAKINYGTSLGFEIIPGAKNLELTSHVFHIGGDPNLNDPDNKFHARNYLEGKDRLGNFPDPCTFLYCEVRGGVNCSEVNPRFWSSGDPVTDIGWISLFNEDTRNLISTGPFKLEKDKPQEIIIAYVMGRGSDYFNSITVARENVIRAIEEYESNFASMTYTPPPPANPVTDYVLYHNYPNPFNPTTTIRYEIPQDGMVTIKIYDILGQEVTTILNEFKKADRYEVKFNSFGLASGVYIYRMKVNDFIQSKKMLLLR